MKIYNPNGKLWREVVALDSSFCEETLERFSRISLDFVLAEEVLVPELCYVTWRGERYSLFSTPKVVKVSTREYRYTLNLEGRHLELDRVLVKDKLGRTKFVFTGRADQYAELISDCLPSWKVGACTTGDTTRVIAFNNTSLLEACRMVASKFETEVQLTDGAISFGRVERYKSDPLLLAYRNGLKKDITVEPDPKETAIGRLYVVGGDRNIDPAKYGGHQLHLLKNGKVSVGGRSFVADAEGRYISLEGDTRLNTSERAFDATSVYPKRVGTVSKVEQVGEEWDVLDSSNTIDYGQHRVGGDTMRLEFQSGRLAGRTFDLATKEDKLVGYVHGEKRFKLVRKEIDGVLMPEPATFYPAVGDKYAIFGCSLPDEYIKAAEGEMLLKGAEYMAERLEPRLQYRAELDGLWAKKNWATVAHKLVVGTIVRLEGASSEVRISSVRTTLNSPYTPRITFSNAPYMVGSLATQIATLENAEVRQREELRAGLVKLQDRTYKDTEAVREMVERLKVEGFSKSLKPETLQTMYAVIGSPALQFEFVGGGFSWTEGKGGAVTIPKQVIRQRVAGTTLEPNPKTVETTIPALTYTLKPDEQQAHIYVELKPTPRYVVSTKPLQITPDRLLVGLLNGGEGVRDFTPLYGFTEISPSHIATRYIRSRSGNMLIDLETGDIYSDKITFKRPDGSNKDIDQVISEGVQVGGRNLAVMSRMVPGYLGDSKVGNPGDIDYKVVQHYPFNYDPTYYPIEEGAKLVWVIKHTVNPKWRGVVIIHWHNENKVFIDRDYGNWTHPVGTPRIITAPKGTRYYRVGISEYPKRIQVKLEKGTVATDWTPAPEDVQAEIQSVERGYQKLIEKVDVEFALSNSRDTAPTSGWVTNAPTPARGQALWQRTKVYLKDGTTEVRGVTCIQGKDGLDGVNGNDGADGRGIAKIVELYYLSSSNTALANGAWTETAPKPKEGYWIWTKTRIHYTTGEQIETQPICVTGNKGDKGDRGERGLQGLQGKDGTDGLPGRDGVDGKTSYTHIAYADTDAGGGFSQNPAGKAYIGMYVDFVQTDSNDPTKYAWSLIKGADGKNGLNGKDGVPGKPGTDGRTPYLHIAYANSQDGKQGFSVTASEGKSYIGTYTDYTQADSTDPTKYSWNKVKGEDAVRVRENLWTWLQYSLAQNDRYGCRLTPLPDRKFKIEKVEASKYSFGGASYYTHPIKNPPGRYTISFKVVECSRPILFYYDTGIDKKKGDLVGDFYYCTSTTNDGRLPAFAFTWGEAHTDDQARIGDYAIIKDIKIERVEEGEDPRPTAYIPHPDDLKGAKGDKGEKGDDGKDVDPKLLNEIQTGLTSATSMIDTLDKAQQALKNGLLDKADVSGIQYLLDSLQNGSTTPSGGLLLTNDIILSDPNTKDVTAMISGTQAEGAKVMRLGINYTCDDDKKTTVSGANAKWGVNLLAELNSIEKPDDSKRKLKLNELGFAIVGGRNLDWTRWEVCKRADLQQAGEATAFDNNGLGHIGELFFNGNYIGFGDDTNSYMQVGGKARAESDMVNASTEMVTELMGTADVNKSGRFGIRRLHAIAGFRDITLDLDLNLKAKARAARSKYRDDTGNLRPTDPKNPSGRYDDETVFYESRSVTMRATIEVLHTRVDGAVVKTLKSEQVSVQAIAPGGSGEDLTRSPELLFGESELNKKVQLVIQSKDLRKGDVLEVFLVTERFGDNDYGCEGRASARLVLTYPKDTSKPEVRITQNKTSFFYGRSKYMLLNYDNLIAKIVGDVLMQGNLAIKGTITADSYQGNGMPLAGATFNSGGMEVRALGRYKNKRSYSFASANYDYSSKSFTVYHSIPHSRYIPLVNAFNDPASPVVSDVSAYSFKVRFTLQSERYNGWAVGFSYIAFQAE